MVRKSDSSVFLTHGVDESSRTIYLNDLDDGQSESNRTATFIKSLILLDKSAPNGGKDINVIMNHSGGDVFEGMAIYDAICNTNNAVIITVMGSAMSIGAIILQAADVRILAPNSVVMIHHGQYDLEEHKKIVENWIKFQRKYDVQLDDILYRKIKEKKTRFKKKDLERLLNFDSIYTAKEATAMGLADCVLGDSNLELL